MPSFWEVSSAESPASANWRTALNRPTEMAAPAARPTAPTALKPRVKSPTAIVAARVAFVIP